MAWRLTQNTHNTDIQKQTKILLRLPFSTEIQLLMITMLMCGDVSMLCKRGGGRREKKISHTHNENKPSSVFFFYTQITVNTHLHSPSFHPSEVLP